MRVKSFRFQYRGSTVEAAQWERSGDHPKDNCAMLMGGGGNEFQSEGVVVRYYRHPRGDGAAICAACGKILHDHGWLDKADITVCPGDWVLEIPVGSGCYSTCSELWLDDMRKESSEFGPIAYKANRTLGDRIITGLLILLLIAFFVSLLCLAAATGVRLTD